ncbi:hypothetical protein Val02_73810 [Virgisporangium aliadipatigenens]|uniref:DUF2891 domain-containing protein n=1 Tax=Virgisporangium aliadipatigenens TaxID=741659 RepID=A0A8J3YVC3_9ACTN|nr:DUF2891 domain-containing protein [Virgisporangium aliadipatigenens]GIJ50495.1 hypothetical protein Val02_73810 [Virgisporangium aliadipatigenens]
MTHWQDLARTALGTVLREYPNDLRHLMNGPDDRPTPRQVHPAFYGSFDWHSCVEMHWVAARLLRLAPEEVPAGEIRAVLDAHLTAENLAAETAYLVARPGFSRPYGRGWALTLVHELRDTPWGPAAAPLGEAVADGLARWLPRNEFPVRYGFHNNGAFALCRSWDYAVAHPGSGLREAIEDAARRWFASDENYPAAWEPGPSDFLSPALTEAELMSLVLPADEFVAWFDRFLPAVPPVLATPVTVSDPTDGQGAHLAGLNYSRARGFKAVTAALPADHPRTAELLASAEAHDRAAEPFATGGDYMVEHWLAAYAVLSLT